MTAHDPAEVLREAIARLALRSTGPDLYGREVDEITEVALTALAPAFAEARADAWDEGARAGFKEAQYPDAFVNDWWDMKTPNPYRDLAATHEEDTTSIR